ncbi:FecR family protein [Halarcobacter bivalviorum]|uniref:Siderophore-interacting protein n=1 Tax=Halarcobacter bivalviorum TaxID=663364 RepID=A0AAX2A8L1_9BACT|nr:FecR domain-containing protein [Halarcobacter bivalviorum]AXH13116.1 sigma factor regulatory protein, FecR family [Halarcobacter bivalviorum]RXK10269.1 siderophore-interacting protein [Halarcobacter bivalviorum]
MKNIEQIAISWLTREEEGLNKKEKSELNFWLNSNEIHKKIYEENKSIRRVFKSLPSQLKDELACKAKKGAKKTKIIEKIKPLAAAAIFILALGFGSFKYNEFVSPTYSNHLVSQNSINKNILLPDNTKIVLDKNSDIEINYFKNKREIKFNEGRAMFYVAKDKTKVFTIDIKNTEIKVLGTAFEVDKFDKKISIKVKEGLVKISKENNNNKYETIALLKKEDSLLLDENSNILSLNKIQINKIANWEEGYILFNDTPLQEAIKQFSRYNEIEASFENYDISQTAITGKFQLNEFDSFIKALPKIYALKIEKKNKKIKFFKN